MVNPISAVASLFDRGFDPARARKLPERSEFGESTVRGLYLAGEIGGTPLIKLGLNRGRMVVDRIAANDLQDTVDDDDAYDILIIGAGSAGLGAADRCQELGLKYVVIEGQRPAQLIRNMTRGKPLLMEPPNEDNQSRLYCEECSKEELLEQWDRQLDELGITPNIRTFEPVDEIEPLSGSRGFTVTTSKGEYTARRVVLAIGLAGDPRKLNVPGEQEHAERIDQNVADPAVFVDRDLLVFGAGDVACEAAIVLADGGNRITMVAPDKEFTFPKKRNIDAVMERVESGSIDLHLGHIAERVDTGTVTIKALDGGATQEVKADHIFRCIGANPPFAFLKKNGVRLEGTWHVKRWLVLVFAFLISYFIYGSKSNPALWPFNYAIDVPPFNGHTFAYWWSHLHVGEGTWMFKLNGSFWYSLAYCLAMTYFGMKAYYRWGVKHDDSYQRKRFASLIIVQWVLAFLIPNVLMWWIHGLAGDNAILGNRSNWWHASGFEYAFPLFFWQFFWDVGWLYLIYGLVSTFIVIPILTIRHGKRYCTWFCGCGGLAETLGDPWRHLAPKGRVAARWEWMNLAVLIWAIVAGVLILGNVGFGHWISGGESFGVGLQRFSIEHPRLASVFTEYQVIADIWLVGIIPVALYPIFGGKIWCRYWCPLAKWMQMTSKWFGTLQISSNEKCITCGECSRFCEVGIDVMAFAKNQDAFHNENTSCIHCGVCITVCPMDVLSFDNDRQGTVSRKLFGARGGVELTINGESSA